MHTDLCIFVVVLRPCKIHDMTYNGLAVWLRPGIQLLARGWRPAKQAHNEGLSDHEFNPSRSCPLNYVLGNRHNHNKGVGNCDEISGPESYRSWATRHDQRGIFQLPESSDQGLTDWHREISFFYKNKALPCIRVAVADKDIFKLGLVWCRSMLMAMAP